MFGTNGERIKSQTGHSQPSEFGQTFSSEIGLVIFFSGAADETGYNIVDLFFFVLSQASEDDRQCTHSKSWRESLR